MVDVPKEYCETRRNVRCYNYLDTTDFILCQLAKRILTFGEVTNYKIRIFLVIVNVHYFHTLSMHDMQGRVKGRAKDLPPGATAW